MNFNSSHDRINLTRLVRRIQQDVDSSTEWQVNPESRRKVALRASAVSRQIAFARQLLKKIEEDELDDPQPSSRQQFHVSIAATLDGVEDAVQEFERRLAVLRTNTKPGPSLLATLPMPTEASAALVAPITRPELTLMPSEDRDEPLAVISPAGHSPPTNADALLPSTKSSFLSTSLQTQEALGDQLVQMAAQLKRNAEHFNTALGEDKTILKSAEEMLEKNLGGMVTQRERLRDYSDKGRSTTCLAFFSVVVVVVAWVVMLFLIRITR